MLLPDDIIFSTFSSVDVMELSSFSNLEINDWMAISCRTELTTLSNPEIATKIYDTKEKTWILLNAEAFQIFSKTNK